MFISLNDIFESRNIKRLPTKPTTVHGKKRVFLRNQHVNPSFEKKQSKSVSHLSFSESKIKDYTKLEYSGVTKGISRFSVDGHSVYFKPIKGEGFFRPFDKKPMRESVVLYNRKTKEVKSPDDINRNNLSNYKGQQADREELAYLLSLHLGMNHIPPTLKRRIKGQTGIVIDDIFSHFKNRYEKIIGVQDAIGLHERGLLGLAQKDKKIGNKIIFDILIGNMDRHVGNMFVGKTKDNKYEMIAFDHGLSFPNDNKKYMSKDLKAHQREFMKMDKQRVTHDFVSKLEKQADSPEKDKFLDLIESKLSFKERRAFEERLDMVKRKLKGARKRK